MNFIIKLGIPVLRRNIISVKIFFSCSKGWGGKTLGYLVLLRNSCSEVFETEEQSVRKMGTVTEVFCPSSCVPNAAFSVQICSWFMHRTGQRGTEMQICVYLLVVEQRHPPFHRRQLPLLVTKIKHKSH